MDSLAASEGNYAIVKFLLNYDQIKVDVKDRWGNTPRDDAIKNGNIKVIEEFEIIYQQSICNINTGVSNDSHLQQFHPHVNPKPHYILGDTVNVLPRLISARENKDPEQTTGSKISMFLEVGSQ
jgi:ankyrin repeat protein